MNSDSFWELLEHFGQLFESYWEPWLWTCLWPCKSAQEAGVAAEWTHLSGFQPNQLPVTADEEEELAILGKGPLLREQQQSTKLAGTAVLFKTGRLSELFCIPGYFPELWQKSLVSYKTTAFALWSVVSTAPRDKLLSICFDIINMYWRKIKSFTIIRINKLTWEECNQSLKHTVLTATLEAFITNYLRY